jgi:hydroxymethylbilane synthase
VPLAVFAIREGDLLRISSLIGMPDGSQVLKAQATGSPDDVEAMSSSVAEDLLGQGANRIIESLR